MLMKEAFTETFLRIPSDFVLIKPGEISKMKTNTKTIGGFKKEMGASSFAPCPLCCTIPKDLIKVGVCGTARTPRARWQTCGAQGSGRKR